MVLEDMPQIMALERGIFTDAWPESVFADQLGALGWTSEVAELGDVIIGYSCAAVVGAEMHLTNIAVAVQHRRKSVAQRLLESILSRATRKLFHLFAINDFAARLALGPQPFRDVPLLLRRETLL